MNTASLWVISIFLVRCILFRHRPVNTRTIQAKPTRAKLNYIWSSQAWNLYDLGGFSSKQHQPSPNFPSHDVPLLDVLGLEI